MSNWLLPGSVILREVERALPGALCWLSMDTWKGDLFICVDKNGETAKIPISSTDRAMSLDSLMEKIRPHLIGVLEGAT